MEQTIKTIRKKRSLIGGAFATYCLKKWANLLIFATKKSGEAGKALLYELPGVFCLSLRYEDREVRVIKESDELRIMKNTEKSEITLTICFKDRAALSEVGLHAVPLQRCFSEGRITAVGSIKHFAVLSRISAEADRLTLSEKAYAKAYGRRK